MASGISLANKCQLLFGAAVVLILAGVLAVPWIRSDATIQESQLEVSRQIALSWLQNSIALTRVATDADDPIQMRVVDLERVPSELDAQPAFVADAVAQLEADPETSEWFQPAGANAEGAWRYVRAISRSQWGQIVGDRQVADFASRTTAERFADPLRAVLVIERRSEFAARQALLNRVYIVATGLVAGLLAILLFWFILTRLILSPVRRLRDTAEKVRRGDLSIRSRISTGDDLQQLSDAFNDMLDRLQQQQEQLRTMNESLDLKVSELAEANVGLFESNRLKSEFLANVSHELRTPLNSIIGFAELLEELARGDPAADPKRLRYIANILGSGRSLLEMINELLAMAKLEAGRMEVSIEPVSIGDLVEGLQAIMRPQAEARRVRIEARLPAALPVVETDPGKLQQILFNFLSNAIKFSPEGSTVQVTAERVKRDDAGPGVRISVIDRGPGIPYDQQETIFRRFRQLESTHTRSHGGTGLGLAICRELGDLLGASVAVVSEPGQGATFSVELPLAYKAKELQALMG